MAILLNTQARLLWGPSVPSFGDSKGYPRQKWSPGKNPVPDAYRDAVRGHSTVKRWVGLGYVEFIDGQWNDPNAPPVSRDLGAMTDAELTQALSDKLVPPEWHSVIEAEISRRSRVDDLGVLAAVAAIPLVEAEMSVERLQHWLETEDRKTVIKALEGRIAVLSD